MSAKQWKNYIIIFGVGILGIIIVAIKIIYFTPSADNTRDSERWKGITDVFKGVSSETGVIYQSMVKNISTFTDTISGKIEYKQNYFDPEARRFQEEMMKKIDEKNIEKLDPFIKDIKTIVPSEWAFSITTIEKGFDSNLIAKIFISNTSTCAMITLEWYGRERADILQDMITRYNSGLLSGMCQKKMLEGIEKYVVIDACLNQLSGCDDEKFMQEILDEYFKNPKS